MSLLQSVAEVFAANGALARIEQNYQRRPQQVAMAEAVAKTIEDGGALVVEAGTGVGKTFAYLVPALLSAERVMVSTASKTLQDQLFGRDLPRLARALGLPVRAALLKGRASYLCLHRMEAAIGVTRDQPALHALARIESWSRLTRQGDLAELPGLDERSPVIPLVTSTRENCLGSQCPKARACHVNLARREAMAADVLVVNHHLFFADMAIRESGMAELLPTVRVVVFDEAHQLNEIGVQFLGQQLGTSQLLDFSRDLLAAGLQLARGLVDWTALAHGLEKAARDFRLVFPRQSGAARLRWTDIVPEGVEPQAWEQALAQLDQACARVQEALSRVDEIAPDFARLGERAADIRGRLAGFARAGDSAFVRWVEVGAQVRLVESPLDIAQTMRSRLFARDGEEQAWGARAWIFTSATLGNDTSLDWFAEPCGLSEARKLRVGSPFDYARQAALYLPEHFCRPDQPQHSLQVADLVASAARRLQGRTLVLTTTLRALRVVGERLQSLFPSGSGLEVLVQGQDSRSALMQRFRDGGAASSVGAILVASASFWEGFDVPGDALQLVVIDKLPFPPPNDPLVEARTRRLELAGRSPFNDYFLPEAAVALRQGAGRLIRSETDRGILAICDVRLSSMSYGQRLLAALPPMRRIRRAEDYESLLDELASLPATTASTRDLPTS